MGKAIFKVIDDNGEERFIVWSSVVDAPVSFACTAEQIVAMFVEEAREDATRMAQQMIERAHTTGSSSRMGAYTLADVAGTNRAGPEESALTEDEIIEFYVRQKKEPTAAALAKYRSSPAIVPIGGSSPALRVPCSVCGAAAGAYCRRPDGSNQIIAHKKRREAEESSR